jgi:hypothetical protein
MRWVVIFICLVAISARGNPATRLRSSTESHAHTLVAQEADSMLFGFAPGKLAEGCAGPYRVALTRASGITVVCARTGGEHADQSDVNRSLVIVEDSLDIDKQAGETVTVLLVRVGPQVRVAGLR